jgi:DNA-binding NtrC family response regulator
MKKTVWLVDDDRGVRSVLHNMLKILGYVCREFADAYTPCSVFKRRQTVVRP